MTTETETLNLTCIDCGAVYELTPDNRRWFEEKNLSLPKRCVPCRKAKRAEMQRGY